jgi:hypothetical protein
MAAPSEVAQMAPSEVVLGNQLEVHQQFLDPYFSLG